MRSCKAVHPVARELPSVWLWKLLSVCPLKPGKLSVARCLHCSLSLTFSFLAQAYPLLRDAQGAPGCWIPACAPQGCFASAFGRLHHHLRMQGERPPPLLNWSQWPSTLSPPLAAWEVLTPQGLQHLNEPLYPYMLSSVTLFRPCASHFFVAGPPPLMRS